MRVRGLSPWVYTPTPLGWGTTAAVGVVALGGAVAACAVGCAALAPAVLGGAAVLTTEDAQDAPEETVALGEQLRGWANQAYQDGKQALTEAQQRALEDNPGLRRAFLGWNAHARLADLVELAQREGQLPSGLVVVKPGLFGPDIIDEATQTWYDLTTPGQWTAHLRRYATATVNVAGRVIDLTGYTGIRLTYPWEGGGGQW